MSDSIRYPARTVPIRGSLDMDGHLVAPRPGRATVGGTRFRRPKCPVVRSRRDGDRAGAGPVRGSFGARGCGSRQPGRQAGARVTDLPTAEAEPGSDDERLTPGQRLSVGLYTTMERVALRWPERPARALFRAYGSVGYRALPKLRAT